MASLQVTKVLLLDGIDPVCADKLSAAGITPVTKGKLTKDELSEEIKEVEAVVVRSATKVTAEVLAAGAPRLRLVGRAGVGTDNIEVDAATRAGVLVMNTPGGNTLSAAEHTCALICSLGRFLPLACASLKGGAWDRKAFLGTELYGKTLGVVGLGRIGREVARRMQSFGMKTIGYDPFVSKEAAEQWGIEAMELEQLWPRADYITVHTPLMEHTRNLVGREVLFKKCKPGVRIVNVARGGIVDEEALYDALESGRCAGAGLDVFVNEPPQDFKLCKHPKVVCTPHLGANTKEAQRRVAEEIADAIVSASRGGSPQGLVNGEGLAAATAAPQNLQWAKLATGLAKVAKAVVGVAEKTTVTVTLYGVQLPRLQKAVEAGALAGLLEDQKANLVNAPVLAQGRGIKVETKQEARVLPMEADYLTVTVQGARASCTASGTVMGSASVLLAIDDSQWATGSGGGVALVNSLVLYRGGASAASPQSLVSIATALSATDVESLAPSRPGRQFTWFAATVTGNALAAKAVNGQDLIGPVIF